MLNTLLQYADSGLIILQLSVAVIFVYHGWPKLKHSKSISAGIGIPPEGVLVLGLVEMAAGLGIGLGVAVQASALALALVMVGAIYYKIKKWKVPFYAQDKTGWEYDLILLAVMIFFLTNAA